MTSAEERLGSEYAGIDVATIEHERQLNAEAEARQRLEMRQAAARAAAHAKMPSTMYASTPSDPHKTPHAMPGSDSRSDSIVELVMPPYLESVAKEQSRPLSQRVRRVLRTIQSVEENRRDFSLDRVRFDHPVSTGTALFMPSTARTDAHAVIAYFPSESDRSGRQGVLRLARAHRTRMKSTNMLERYNEEIRRRTRVIRIFPNEASCLRLIRALAVETHDQWVSGKRYLTGRIGLEKETAKQTMQLKKAA